MTKTWFLAVQVPTKKEQQSHWHHSHSSTAKLIGSSSLVVGPDCENLLSNNATSMHQASASMTKACDNGGGTMVVVAVSAHFDAQTITLSMPEAAALVLLCSHQQQSKQAQCHGLVWVTFLPLKTHSRHVTPHPLQACVFLFHLSPITEMQGCVCDCNKG